MPLYELLINPNDEADLASGTKRKKEGDILAIMPYPWQWGKKEIENNIVVIIELSETDFNKLDMKFTMDRLYEDGRSLEEIIEERDLHQKQVDINLGLIPGTVAAVTPLKPISNVSCANRYRIGLNDIVALIPSFDINKAKQKGYIYQPFKNSSQLVSAFDGKNGSYSIDSKDVDCGTSDNEVFFTEQQFNSVLEDKNGIK